MSRWMMMSMLLAGCVEAGSSDGEALEEAESPGGKSDDASDAAGLGEFGGTPDATSFPAAGRLVVEDVALGCEGEIFEGGQSWCGSVLVTPTVSLTAAHCLQALVDKDRSLATIELQGQAYRVSEWSLDPTFGGFHRGSQDHQTPLRPLATANRHVPMVGNIDPSLEPPTITSRLANAGLGSDVAVIVHERVDHVAPAAIYLEEVNGMHADGFVAGEEFTLISYGPSHGVGDAILQRDARHRASIAANTVGSGGGHTKTRVKRDFSFYAQGRPQPQTRVDSDKVEYGYFSAVAGSGTPEYLACKGDSGSPAFAGMDGASWVVGVMHGFSTAAGSSNTQTTKLEDPNTGCTVCNPRFGLASLGSIGARTFVCGVLTDDERTSLESTTPGYCPAE